MNIYRPFVLAQNWISKYPVIAIILLCIISRLPLLLNPHLLLDGDESIVGLMANHLIKGKEIPIFFYGQAYGFSLIEIAVIGIFYSIIGMSTIAVKLAMLTLWIIGVVFFYKTIDQIEHKNKGLQVLITLLLIFSPSIVIWSLKARGGYMTAFFMSSIITFLTCRRNGNSNYLSSFLIGIMLIVIYQSQALWLAGLMPFVIYYLVKKDQVKRIVLLIFGLASAIYWFNRLKADLSSFWNPTVIDWSNLDFHPVFTIIEKTYQSFSGSYVYGNFIEPVLVNQIFSFIITAIILFIAARAIFLLWNKKEINSLFYVSCFSVLLTIGYTLFLREIFLRYFLPLTGFSLLMIYIYLSSLRNSKIGYVTLIVMLLLAMLSTYNFKDFVEDNNSSDIKALAKELEKREIKYAFCEGGLLQWQLAFLTEEKTITRFYPNFDRYPKYIQLNNLALKRENKNLALVGYYDEQLDSNKKYTAVGNAFFIIENPSKELILKRGFDLGTDFDDL